MLQRIMCILLKTFSNGILVLSVEFHLQVVHLVHVPSVAIPIIMGTLKELRDLHLSFQEEDVPDEEAMKLEKLELETTPLVCPDLRKLEFRNLGGFTSKAMQNIVCCCQNIKVAHFSNCKSITNEVLDIFGKGVMGELEVLMLYGCKDSFSDEGIFSIAEYCSKKLSKIDLRQCNAYSDSGLERLFKNCWNLRTIHLSAGGNITSEAVSRMRQHYHHIDVYYF